MNSLLALAMFASLAQSADICSEASHQFIPITGLPMVEQGYTFVTDERGRQIRQPLRAMAEPRYIRVHPSGNFVIATLGGGKAVIIDIRDKANPKLIESPLKDEAYPVEPNWDFISSPYAKEGMEYYSFEDLLKKGKDAKPVLSDRRHNEYYQSSAELPGSGPGHRKFRTVLYGTLSSRDYSVKKIGEGRYQSRAGSVQYLCENVQVNLMQPILSKDGAFLAANEMADSQFSRPDRGGTVVLKILPGGKCKEVERVGFATSKVSFSYPKSGHPGYLAFSGQHIVAQSNGSVSSKEVSFVYDRKTKETRLLSLPWHEDYGQYPGFTKDGRIIYVSKRTDQVGLVIVDPKKLPKVGTGDDVFKEVARCFASRPNHPAPSPSSTSK